MQYRLLPLIWCGPGISLTWLMLSMRKLIFHKSSVDDLWLTCRGALCMECAWVALCICQYRICHCGWMNLCPLTWLNAEVWPRFFGTHCTPSGSVQVIRRACELHSALFVTAGDELIIPTYHFRFVCMTEVPTRASLSTYWEKCPSLLHTYVHQLQLWLPISGSK